MKKIKTAITAIINRIRNALGSNKNALGSGRKWKYETFGLFDHTYLDARIMYVRTSGILPNIHSMDNVDMDKAFDYFFSGNAGTISNLFQKNYYNWKEAKLEFDKTIITMGNSTMIELGNEQVNILFSKDCAGYANTLVDVLAGFRTLSREEQYEINIITLGSYGLELKTIDIQTTELDIDLYYNDDFKAVDSVIRDRLSGINDKGIILLHGMPGTGKTTYLRHLIGGLKKKVLFVSPAVAGRLVNPEFIDLLIENPNSVVIIEDAENIIMDRKLNSDSSVSNLLNISDGLLSDCLNVQLICTFNSSLNTIDSALLRKGRLIARYEFGKLQTEKAARLAKHLGIDREIIRPMTLAELTNPDGFEELAGNARVGIGFRKELIQN